MACAKDELQIAYRLADHEKILKICANNTQYGQYFDDIVKQVIIEAVRPLKKLKEKKEKYIDWRTLYDNAKTKKIKFNTKIKLKKMLNINDDEIVSVNATLYKIALERSGNGRLWKKYQLYTRMHEQKDLTELSLYMKYLGRDED